MGDHLHEAEVLARALGDQRRLARIATFMGIQCLITGDYDEAVRFGREALSIARTLSDRSIEAVATMNLGLTHTARGEFSDAATFLERNVTLEDDLRYERFGATFIPSARSGAGLADVLSQLGRFDEAIGHAEAAVRIAETVDHPYTLYWGLFDLGRVHLRRGDLRRATRVLERCLDLGRTWQFVFGTPLVAAALGAAYALVGRADEALPLVAGLVEEFGNRQFPNQSPFVFLYAGMTYLSAGRIDEAASHAREALALTRRLGARASEAHALCLAGDVASTDGAEDAEGYYREALALAGELGMRPLVAHCHLGLGKLYRRTGKRRAGPRAPHHRDDDVPRDGHALLAGAGGGGHGSTSVRNCRGVMTRSGSRARRSIQRPKSATSPVTKWLAWAPIAAARSGRSFDDSSGGVSSSTSAGAGSLTTRTAVRPRRNVGSAAGRLASRFRSASMIARGEVRSVTRPAAPSSIRSAESPSGLYAAVKRTFASRNTRRSATTATAPRGRLEAPAPAQRRPLMRVHAIRHRPDA